MHKLKFWFPIAVVLFAALLVQLHKADATTIEWVSNSAPSSALAATITTTDPLIPGVNVVPSYKWTISFGIPSATYVIPGGYPGNTGLPQLTVTISPTGSVESLVTSIVDRLYCGYCFPGSPYGDWEAFLQTNSIGVMWESGSDPVAPLAPFTWIYDNLGNTISLPVVSDTGRWVISPEEQAQAIQDFVDSSVEQGTLVGNGPNNNASKGKLKAFQNMLKSAYDLIESGDIQGACNQLMAAYKKTDGQPNPPDFVKGDAAVQLASMIQNLMDSLECQ